eukprot:g1829.t1
MELVTSKRKIVAEGQSIDTRLSLYNCAPDQAISLEEFEQFAYDRLQVLRTIHRATESGQKGEELRGTIRRALEQHLPLRNKDDQRKDNVSHFVLRLAFCRKQEDRNWLCQQETTLFKYRFEGETSKEVDCFMRKNNLHYEQLSAEEKARYSTELQQVFRANKYGSQESKFESQYFKVPFEQAIGLMQRRQVFLRGGFAFVPRDHLIELLRLRFRESLSRSLAKAFKFFPQIVRDGRIAPMVKNLSRQYMGKDYASNATASIENMTAEQVDSLSKKSFPMCMSNLHHELKRQHHLKHSGRLQFGLFLKGIGLSMEEALRFWKREFAKKMSGEDFEKHYAYNIRHNYGKEGKRANYTPHSCKKIILGETPAHGQHNGCPFKHWNEQSLRSRLAKLKVSSSDVNEICDSVRSGDYQVACLKHFEVTHPGASTTNVGNHPNGWFEASVRHYSEKDQSKKGSEAAAFAKSFVAPAGGAAAITADVKGEVFAS